MTATEDPQEPKKPEDKTSTPNWQSYVWHLMRIISPTPASTLLLLLLVLFSTICLMQMGQLANRMVSTKEVAQALAPSIRPTLLLRLFALSVGFAILCAVYLREFLRRSQFREEFGVLWKKNGKLLLPYPFCPRCRLPIGLPTLAHFAHCDPCQYWAPFRLMDLPTIWRNLGLWNQSGPTPDYPHAVVAPQPEQDRSETPQGTA